ncbi:glycosyltransferase family 2 protein [Suipraeoptans intestinalis]|uniref:glycosyltransferase family 2 protein n=1 Tax=Suipraeoptans intestinalis TaxID=2606628 RepID=UPI002A7583FB|nr:glycosyltransferase [Suipraeoptans intestinalis]MDY3121172.1 glycosyltransferase [Suipraeoptans intestinalis]
MAESRKEREMGREQISIVIPVYGAEKYLKELLDKLLRQEDPEVEILCIDDGSVDKSQEICRAYAQAHPCIRYYRKENRGVSHTRNFGIQKARGTWICFVDSDDYLEKGAIARLRPYLGQETDALYFNYHRGEKDRELTGRVGDFEAKEILRATLDQTAGQSEIRECFTLQSASLAISCAKLYRLDVIRKNGIQFPEQLRIGEDVCFNLQYLGRSRKVRTLDEALYYYRKTPGSTTQTYSGQHFLEEEKLIRQMAGYREEAAEFTKELRIYLLGVLLHINTNLGKLPARRHRIREYRKLLRDADIRWILEKTEKKEALSPGKYQNLYYHLAVKLLQKNRIHLAVCLGDLYRNLQKFFRTRDGK